jgi:MFS family permease
MVPLLRQRNFALLWLAGLVSLAGDWALLAVLPFYVYERTDSTLASAMVWRAYALPGLLVGSIAGVFADRWDRRRTVIVANLAAGGGVLGLLLATRPGWLWIVYPVIFLEGTLRQFPGPAESALLPRLVGEDRLLPAKALNALNDNLGRIAGPVVGGALGRARRSAGRGRRGRRLLPDRRRLGGADRRPAGSHPCA